MAVERNKDFADPLIEDPTEGDDELGYPIRYTITSYGSDMPIDGLVDRLKREDIFVPEFQRNFVWTIVQASRFIESLLLGLPVPGVFLFKEPETNKLMVVDGQQRLLTPHSFYKGVFGDIDRGSGRTRAPGRPGRSSGAPLRAT